jgi:hypothetical protein
VEGLVPAAVGSLSFVEAFHRRDAARKRYLLCLSPFSDQIDSTWEARHPDTIIWIQYYDKGYFNKYAVKKKPPVGSPPRALPNPS